MEARSPRAALFAGAPTIVGTSILAVLVSYSLFFCVLSTVVSTAQAAGYRGVNFTVSASTPELAREIGVAAERQRKELALEWLGKEMPPWSKPCPITAQVDPRLGAGGATSFLFQDGEVFDWKMTIQGSRERILDSVLPHEITHTVFASYFRRPLPRWADEGACTTVEHKSEKEKQHRMLIRFLQTGQGIAFSDLFAMKEYPANVMPLYSQGYSLARFLIDHGGRRKFLAFLGDGMSDENWPRAVRKHYGAENLWALQGTWLDWVKAGSPRNDTPSTEVGAVLVAQNTSSDVGARSKRGAQSESGVIYRAQSEDPPRRRSPRARLAAGSVASSARESPAQSANAARDVAGAGRLVSIPQGGLGRVAPSVYERHESDRDRGATNQTALSGQPTRRIEQSTDHARDQQDHTVSPVREPRVLLEWDRSESRESFPASAFHDASSPRATVLR